MSRDRTLLWTVLTVVVLVTGLAVLGWIAGPGPLAVDTELAPPITLAMPAFAVDAFDTLASLPVALAIGLVGFVASFAAGRRPMAAAFLLGLLAEVPTAIVKAVVDRPRPPGSAEIEAIGTIASYPSGHTVRAVVLAGLVVAAFAWAHRGGLTRVIASAVAVAIVGLVGLARIASGQHWPSDVIGGLLLGSAWLAICLAFAGAVEARAPGWLSRPPPG